MFYLEDSWGYGLLFIVYLLLCNVTVNLPEIFLLLFESGNDFFFYNYFITGRSLLIKAQIQIKVDGQALQNRKTLGDVTVISIVNIALKVQQSKMLTGVLEEIKKNPF